MHLLRGTFPLPDDASEINKTIFLEYEMMTGRPPQVSSMSEPAEFDRQRSIFSQINAIEDEI
jgi:hypothetical protein